MFFGACHVWVAFSGWSLYWLWVINLPVENIFGHNMASFSQVSGQTKTQILWYQHRVSTTALKSNELKSPEAEHSAIRHPLAFLPFLFSIILPIFPHPDRNFCWVVPVPYTGSYLCEQVFHHVTASRQCFGFHVQLLVSRSCWRSESAQLALSSNNGTWSITMHHLASNLSP